MKDGSSDAELVAATANGDSQAFAKLVHKYRDHFARYATRMVGDSDEAEDVLQSAFLRAYRHIARCDEPARFEAWLHRIVVNECRTWTSRRSLRDRRLVREEAVLGSIASKEVLSDSALQTAIGKALRTLPADLREAFLLKHVEELEYEEMAEVTGAGLSALKMRVKRACERLRERLGSVIDD